MNDGLIPRRYAKALLKFAQEKGQAPRIYALMKTLAGSFAAEDQLSTVVKNPFVPASSKLQLINTAAGVTDADTVFADFLKLLVENNRIDWIRGIALAYLQLYRQANNIYPVEIVTASKMPEAEMSRIKALIEKHLDGATVEYSTKVDPDLIGGFVINIESERLDASIKNELKQLRLKLLNNA